MIDAIRWLRISAVPHTSLQIPEPYGIDTMLCRQRASIYRGQGRYKPLHFISNCKCRIYYLFSNFKTAKQRLVVFYSGAIFCSMFHG